MRGVEKGGMAVLEGNPTGKHTVICIVSSAHRGLWIPIATGKHMEAYRKAHNE